MVKPGNPFETCTSTETGYPTAPLSVAESTDASTTENGRAHAQSLSAGCGSRLYMKPSETHPN